MAFGRAGVRQPNRAAAARSQADVARQTAALELGQAQATLSVHDHGAVDLHPELPQRLAIRPGLLQAAQASRVLGFPQGRVVAVPNQFHGRILVKNAKYISSLVIQ
jgi:hypothetical protein